MRIDLIAALESFPAHYLEVILLRDFAELTSSAMALKLDMQVPGVKSRLHRARELVREYLVGPVAEANNKRSSRYPHLTQEMFKEYFMKSTVSRFAPAALTAATLALSPAMASADEATAKCAPKTVERVVRELHTFKQIRRGRPGPDSQYKKLTRKRYDLEWVLDQATIAYDEKFDGMYPLLCNDRSLSPAAVLTARKGQPTLEKRFEQTKTVHEIAPVFLKSPARIEALFTLYFMVLLVQALIERELRRAMRREHIDSLPLYPEARPCKRPTTEHILRLCALAERHSLTRNARVIQVFDPALNPLQHQVLTLLGVHHHAFSA